MFPMRYLPGCATQPIAKLHFCLITYLIWPNYSDLTRPGPPKGSWGREILLFQGYPGGWNIMIWPNLIGTPINHIAFIAWSKTIWLSEWKMMPAASFCSWVVSDQASVFFLGEKKHHRLGRHQMIHRKYQIVASFGSHYLQGICFLYP